MGFHLPNSLTIFCLDPELFSGILAGFHFLAR